MVQGLFDAEIWKTDPGSRLLSLNDGDAAAGGRLRLWSAGDFLPGLQGYMLGQAHSGTALPEEEGKEGQMQTGIEQAFLRYTLKGATRLVIEGGKFTTPVGDFSDRYLSSQNPLIGTPDSYTVAYPYGVKMSGWAGPVDYRAALVDQPMVNEGYVPESGRAWRPVVGAGVTPVQGLRLGAFYTFGPYLGPEVESALPTGSRWRDFEEAVVGFETQFSRGHFELRGEFTHSRYDAPTGGPSVRGQAFYLEPKYTFTPRVFAALRLEQNEYAYISLMSWGWLVSEATFVDAEACLGWRLAPGAILKVSYRRDRWDVDESLKSILPDGYALAAQLSYSFDVISWFERPR